MGLSGEFQGVTRRFRKVPEAFKDVLDGLLGAFQCFRAFQGQGFTGRFREFSGAFQGATGVPGCFRWASGAFRGYHGPTSALYQCSFLPIADYPASYR